MCERMMDWPKQLATDCMLSFDSDFLTFTVQGIMLTLRIIEREPQKCVTNSKETNLRFL